MKLNVKQRDKKKQKKKIVVLNEYNNTASNKGGFTSTFTKQQPEELSAKIN